jgi:predicted transcriptional regulator
MSGPKSSLQLARESVAVSRGELAIGAGVSVHTIESVEVGRRRATAATAERIERALLRHALARLDVLEDAVRAVAALDAATEAAPMEARS